MHLGEPVELALRFLDSLFRQSAFVDFGAVLVDLHPTLFGLAQFLLDGFELLAQVIFTLALVHIAFDLGLNLVAQFQNAELVIDQPGNDLQAFRGILCLQDLLFFPGAGIDA